jgi:hypothetical protein
MASMATFRARHLAVTRKFLEAYEELLNDREEWIALGGAAYTDELEAGGGEWTAPTETQFDDSMYAIGALERFMNGDFHNTNNPLDPNVYRLFLYRVAD